MVFRNLPFPEACLPTFHGIDYDVSIDAIVALGKQKQNGCLIAKIVLIKVLREEKRLRRLMSDHTASLEITVNV